MEKRKKIDKNWCMLIVVFLIVIIISILLILSMGGSITTTGEWSEKTSESLSCKATNINYEFFGKDTATSSNNVKVNAIFNNNKIISINLVRKMTYVDPETAKIWSDSHEFYMNRSFGENNLGAYALNANYNVDESTAQMSIYAANGDINDNTIRYFMLDSLPKDIDEYKKGYSGKGFTCEIVKGNNSNNNYKE